MVISPNPSSTFHFKKKIYQYFLNILSAQYFAIYDTLLALFTFSGFVYIYTSWSQQQYLAQALFMFVLMQTDQASFSLTKQNAIKQWHCVKSLHMSFFLPFRSNYIKFFSHSLDNCFNFYMKIFAGKLTILVLVTRAFHEDHSRQNWNLNKRRLQFSNRFPSLNLRFTNIDQGKKAPSM